MNLIFESIASSENLVYSLGIAFVLQLAIYFCICGYVAIAVDFMHRRSKMRSVLDDRPLKQGQIRTEVSSSVVTSAIYAAYMLMCFRLSSGLYPESVLEGVIHMISFLFFYDFLNYFTHRILHKTKLKKFHAHHHSSVRVNTWSSSCMHPVEAILNQIPFILFVLITPVSSLMITIFYMFFMLGMATGHSNYSLVNNLAGMASVRRWGRFHQRHHEHGNVNYGFAGTHWDFVFGTNYKESRVID
jgi:lathosterol oxidase